MTPSPKVALSHDWLNGMRGGEKCLEVLCEIYPDSPIYTLFYDRRRVSETIARHSVHASKLQKFPGILSYYRYYLPFFSQAVETFDLKGFDLVVSTSHCVAKGIKKKPGAVHVCYCFTPVRYTWDLFEEYFGKKNLWVKRIIGYFLNRLRSWDLNTNASVDHFVAISKHVQKRIQKFYGRDADVIYPPVDTLYFVPDSRVRREDFYLVVSALVPYKRIDLAVRAFNLSGRRLVIIGDGPEMKMLKKQAKKNIEFLGWKPDPILRDYYRKARALIFPGEEDFGIVPLEMQACGGFVIAYEKGGATETVIAGKTGIFFNESTEEALNRAVDEFESSKLQASDAVTHAAGFSRERFKNEIHAYLENIMRERQNRS